MNTTVSYREICAKRLREARGKRSTTTVAKATGVSDSAISRYENNKREIGLVNLCKLAKYYDEDLNYLAGLID